MGIFSVWIPHRIYGTAAEADKNVYFAHFTVKSQIIGINHCFCRIVIIGWVNLTRWLPTNSILEIHKFVFMPKNISISWSITYTLISVVEWNQGVVYSNEDFNCKFLLVAGSEYLFVSFVSSVQRPHQSKTKIQHKFTLLLLRPGRKLLVFFFSWSLIMSRNIEQKRFFIFILNCLNFKLSYDVLGQATCWRKFMNFTRTL